MAVGCEVVVVMVVRSVDLMMKLITFRFRLVTVALQHEPCQLYLDLAYSKPVRLAWYRFYVLSLIVSGLAGVPW